MQTLHTSHELNKALKAFRDKKKTIGFVPTMGSLHEGHLSLARQAKKENKIAVVSIFVNPLQFGPKEDFWRYPRNLVRDTELLRKERVDFIFAPSYKDFYREDFQTSVTVRELSGPLCGLTRPTHFSGVATVVLKLLNIVRPNRLYLGQKDYQQYRLLDQMVTDLEVPVEVKMVPTVREKDGLAMSSRNIFLSGAERREAPFLHRSLLTAAELVRGGVRETARLKKSMRETLALAPHCRVEYLEIVDAGSLQPVLKLRNGMKALVALACFFGKTRLIDNLLVTV